MEGRIGMLTKVAGEKTGKSVLSANYARVPMKVLIS